MKQAFLVLLLLVVGCMPVSKREAFIYYGVPDVRGTCFNKVALREVEVPGALESTKIFLREGVRYIPLNGIRWMCTPSCLLEDLLRRSLCLSQAGAMGLYIEVYSISFVRQVKDRSFEISGKASLEARSGRALKSKLISVRAESIESAFVQFVKEIEDFLKERSP